jgi:hypothetical protein
MPLQLVRLTGLMAMIRGRADVVIAVLDGPIALDGIKGSNTLGSRLARAAMVMAGSK